MGRKRRVEPEVRNNAKQSRYELVVDAEVVDVAEFIDANPEYQDLLVA